MKMNIKKLLYGAAPLAMAVPLVFAAGVLVSPGNATAAISVDNGYIGTTACLACHNGSVAGAADETSFLESGHPYKYRQTNGKDCNAGACDAISNILPTPLISVLAAGTPTTGLTDSDGDSNLDWKDIDAVIGGWGWKARFIVRDKLGDLGSNSTDDTGVIWTGSAVQYNVLADNWSAYHDDASVHKYNCSRCHNTNGTKDLTQSRAEIGTDSYGSMHTFDGVQCEGCHANEVRVENGSNSSNGAAHAANPTGVDMMGAATVSNDRDGSGTANTNDMCGRCHNRVSGDEPAIATGAETSGGYIRHHEQYNELVGSTAGGAAHYTLACTDCHDPHVRIHTVPTATATALGITDNDLSAVERGAVVACQSCHPGHGSAYNAALTTAHADLVCIDCHMAEAVKSATAETGTVWGRKGDVKSHIVKINTGNVTSTAAAQPAEEYLTLDFVCGKCHDTSMSTYSGTTSYASIATAATAISGFTSGKYHRQAAIAAPAAIDGGYEGSSTCGQCHVDKYNDFTESGHPYKFRQTSGADCATGACDAISNILPTPAISDLTGALTAPTDADSDGKLDWKDVDAVIGGWGWKARFVALSGADTGYIWTGANVQYNVLADGVVRSSWSNYHDDAAKHSYNCSRCHNTNGTKDLTQSRTEIGTNGYGSKHTFDGVQCEGCHAAAVRVENAANSSGASVHVADPRTDVTANPGVMMGVADTADANAMCGRCHNRVGDDEPYTTTGVEVSGGFSRHHEQYNEVVGYNSAGAHATLDCVDCHNPHKRVHKVPTATATALGITDNADSAETRLAVVACESCHSDGSSTTQIAPYANLAGVHKYYDVACVDCHMAEATKSATAQSGDWGKMGDVKSHITRISATATVDTNAGDITSSVTGKTIAHDYLSLNYVCGKCHDASMASYVGVELTEDEAYVFAPMMHEGMSQSGGGTGTQSANYARINWYKGAGCNTIAVDGSMNDGTCTWTSADAVTVPSACTGDIDFGNAGDGKHTVTLTMSTGATRTITVTSSGNSLVPNAANTVSTAIADTSDSTGMSAKLTDTSSSNACGGSAGVGTIVWGDGSVSTGIAKDGTETHAYSVAGTYMVRYSFRDSTNNKKAMADAVRITVPDTATAVFDVTGQVLKSTGEALKGANMYLYNTSNSVVKFTGTDASGNYTFYNVAPQAADADYTIEAKKNGYTFAPVTTDNDKADNAGVGHTDKDFTATVNW